jgi:hypothetical protein
MVRLVEAAFITDADAPVVQVWKVMFPI